MIENCEIKKILVVPRAHADCCKLYAAAMKMKEDFRILLYVGLIIVNVSDFLLQLIEKEC